MGLKMREWVISMDAVLELSICGLGIEWVEGRGHCGYYIE
jgi:hypothetical protein